MWRAALSVGDAVDSVIRTGLAGLLEQLGRIDEAEQVWRDGVAAENSEQGTG
jgi:hypothetical protein